MGWRVQGNHKTTGDEAAAQTFLMMLVFNRTCGDLNNRLMLMSEYAQCSLWCAALM
jgi:hypothetical protein